MVALDLATPEVAFLARFLQRLRSWDERAAVRVQVRGELAGVFGSLPMEALALVVIPLAAPVTGGDADRTVSAGRLRDILGDATAPGPRRSIRLPDPVAGPASLAVVPPGSGWVSQESGFARDVAELVATAVAAYRQTVPVTGSPGADLAASSTWDGPGWGAMPMRGLHAAQLLGFLANPDAEVRIATVGGWVRMVTPAGQVMVRTAGRLTLVLSPS